MPKILKEIFIRFVPYEGHGGSSFAHHISGFIFFDSFTEILKDNAGRKLEITCKDSAGYEGYFFKNEDGALVDVKGNQLLLSRSEKGHILSWL